MNKNVASCWAQNNRWYDQDSVPREILQETSLEVVANFLAGLYQAQDYGRITFFEHDSYKFACGVQALWTKFGIKTDRIMPLDKDIRNIIRPIDIDTNERMYNIMYLDSIWKICYKGCEYKGLYGAKCTYCDNR